MTPEIGYSKKQLRNAGRLLRDFTGPDDASIGPTDLREYRRVIADYFELREQDEEPGQGLIDELSNLFAATRRYYPEEVQQ